MTNCITDLVSWTPKLFDVTSFIAFLSCELPVWLKFITLLFLKLTYNIFILVRYFFLIINCAKKLSIESVIIYTEWYGMTGKCSKYSKKCNIYLFIVCVLCNYIVSLTNRSRGIICFVVEMCFRPLATISLMKFICSSHIKREFLTV